MKIVAIEVCPLTGGTVDGGWPQGHEPQENLHTLLIVRTDEGLVGLRELLHVGQARGRGGRAALAAAPKGSRPSSRSASPRRSASRASGRDAAARSSTRSAASTSPSGT